MKGHVAVIGRSVDDPSNGVYVLGADGEGLRAAPLPNDVGAPVGCTPFFCAQNRE